MDITLKLPRWNIEEMCGYKPITTFWDDFSIADNFGIDAVCDTYNRAFQEWKTDYKYLTELVMVLNWKIWSTTNTMNRSPDCITPSGSVPHSTLRKPSRVTN